MNLHHAQVADEQVSNPLEAGHADEGLSQLVAPQDQQGPPQDGEQPGEPSDAGEAAAEASKIPLEFPPTLLLPQPPAVFFAREGMVNELLDLVEQFLSFSLFGAGGLGKSSIALTLLHHDRVKIKFGRNRHFVRCDDLANSSGGFLERLSNAIGIPRMVDVTQLRSHLGPSPLLLVFDGVDSVLDPLATGAAETARTIEEIGQCRDVCLLTTGRLNAEIPGFCRVEVPTLSEDGAQDTFYSLCHVGRSSAVNDLIAKLDFHPLSINLLASVVHEKNWDEPTLSKAWGDDKTSILEMCHRQCLKDVVESSVRTPSIQGLGTTARNALEAIAVFPDGAKESMLHGMFPGIPGIGEAVAVLCKFSLLYRKDGFVKMLSPFQFYFLESIEIVIHAPGNDTIRIRITGETTGGGTTRDSPTDEVIGSDTTHDLIADEDTICYAEARSFFLIHPYMVLE